MKHRIVCLGILACLPFRNCPAETNSPGSNIPSSANSSALNSETTPARTSTGRVINSKEEMLTLLSNGICQVQTALMNTNLHPANRELLEKNLKLKQDGLELFRTNDFVPIRIGDPPPQIARMPAPAAVPALVPPPNGGRLPQRTVRPPGDRSALIQSNFTAQVELMRTNPAAARTNGFDPIAIGMQQSIANYEADATNVDPVFAQNLRQITEQRKAQLADWRTNSQLLQNVRQARALKDPEKVEKAKQELADYLAAKMGKPPGTKLDDLLSEIRQSSASTNAVSP